MGGNDLSPLSLIARPWIGVISVRIVCWVALSWCGHWWTFVRCCLLICLPVIIKGCRADERIPTDGLIRIRNEMAVDKKRHHQFKGNDGVVFMRPLGGFCEWCGPALPDERDAK